MRISDWSSDVCSSDLYDKAGRRIVPPAPGKAVEHQVAPGHRIGLAQAVQNLRPLLGHDAEELQRLLPVRRDIFRHCLREPRSGHFLGHELVERAGKLARSRTASAAPIGRPSRSPKRWTRSE